MAEEAKRRKFEITRRGALTAAAGAALLPFAAGLPIRQARGAAPYLEPAYPTHYRFRLGDFEITTIMDARATIDGPWPIVGQDQPQEKVEALMRENLLPETRFRPGFTPTIVNTGKELILFDTGNGDNGFVPRPDGGWLSAQLGPAGFKPEDFDIVVLTHCHPDHVGGLMEKGKWTFPNARYVIGAKEHDFWRGDAALSADKESNDYKSAVLFRSHVAPLDPKLTRIEPGDSVVPGIEAVAAFGHTPGHLAFHLESNGKQLLLWADCAHHEVASLARPDWDALFDMDKAQGAETRRRIYAMAARERLPVAGYHTSFPSVGFVEEHGSGYRWVPVTYQLDL
ncbi:N-acyl homoserine lactonase [Methyloligella halotolerans]|uniref:N-acyl homoserine lactonase n=1 Tax=Methyloligella halotolerans TaxID=1177755 RepID=A0A1E2RZ53_9HYPH|nr:MBL fold metallo-hydrolase [Methyloligella halotolerans]ODA67432.1 N-acyl homoserine lactonase [Methyloligella halotolerans]